MSENPKDILQQVLDAKRRAMTPEKRKRREEVDARNARIQEVGVKQPASGTFGKPSKS